MHSIGKLAGICNISVRTLRYYDEIDLLKPSKIERGGHRFYSNEAVVKLHTIIALKDIGFGLEKIHEIIDEKRSLKESMQMRLHIIKLEQERLKEKEDSVRYVLQVMELEDVSDLETTYETIFDRDFDTEEIHKLWSKNFTSSEKQILNKLPRTGTNEIDNWIKLIKDIRVSLDKEPSSNEAQELAKRWMQLTDEIYKGDHELAQKAWRFSREQGNISGFYQFDKKIVDYITEAIDHMYANQVESDSE